MKFWNSLSSREKFTVGYGVPLILLVICYVFYLQPLNENLKQLRIDVPQKSAELEWAKHKIENASDILGSDPSTSDDSPSPILTLIENRAIETNIKNAIQRVQPSGNQTVKIWFQDVVGDSWFEFINHLARDRIAVEAATLTRTENGKMNVRVTLDR